MKRTLISFVVFGMLAGLLPTVQAQTKTPVKTSVTPTKGEKETTPSGKLNPTSKVSPTSANSDVEQLRKKLAEKVTELKKKNYKPYSGEITKLADTTLTIETRSGEMEVKIDSTVTTIYQISGSTKKEIKTDDLEKGDYIIVTGPVLDKTIDANLIFRDETFVVGSGKIVEVDTDGFLVKVITQDKSNYSFDIEKNTQMQLLNIKTLEPEKIGFSKLKEGDMIHYVADKPKEKTSTRFSAVKLLVIPQEYFNK